MTLFPSPARLWILALAVAGCVALSGCGTSSSSSAQNLDVKELKLVTLESTGERSFSGILVNKNSKTLSIVQIEVALYDEGGSRVGTTTIEVEDVPANGEKEFQGPLDTDVPVAGARVRSLMAP